MKLFSDISLICNAFIFQLYCCIFVFFCPFYSPPVVLSCLLASLLAIHLNHFSMFHITTVPASEDEVIIPSMFSTSGSFFGVHFFSCHPIISFCRQSSHIIRMPSKDCFRSCSSDFNSRSWLLAR
ncbi:hypothetical protein SAY87_003909 [Trapa incisa]|uniref:Uncharacterized protein n=1 Tax=Trapa incisa TaxID=236973 RepID=A0AAN7JNH5_9MYRT|nr:hypothetical protein SAY87_003909 [Trapa incisa]